VKPEFTRQYFFDTTQECEWKLGATWKMGAPDGTVTASGEVLEIEPAKRLVLKWRNEYKPEAKAEGYARMTYTLEPEGDRVKLTVLHEMDVDQSKFISPGFQWLADHPVQPRACWKQGMRLRRRARGSACLTILPATTHSTQTMSTLPQPSPVDAPAVPFATNPLQRPCSCCTAIAATVNGPAGGRSRPS